MRSSFTTMLIRDIVHMTLSKTLNPDPISQRPAVSSGVKKSQEIVEAILNNYGVGMLTVRDITNDESMQKIYPGQKYLVIDGGHRVRALTDFYQGRFKVFQDKSFNKVEYILDKEIAVEIITCTSAEAIHIFRTRNKTTGVNFIEMIMCDETSTICREVRSRTKYYSEYNNKPLSIFESYNSKSYCFDSEPNPRRKWDEYVMIAILKAIGGGNVDAGQREIEKLVLNETEKNINPVNKNVLSVVDRFFADAYRFKETREKSFTGDSFAAFQVVWFGLYEKNKNFTIENMRKFMSAFMYAYTVLTGRGDSKYNNKTILVETQNSETLSVNIKDYVRSNTKNFSNSVVQRKCAELFFDEMGEDNGVVFREEKRSMNTSEREEALARQGYVCAIDGLPLFLKESVLGHDTAWAKGGRLTDGAVIRKTHNRDMGSTTLNEYRTILKMRGEPVSETALNVA